MKFFMKELIINVEGMVCGGCENRVNNVVSQIEGVEKVVANHEDGIVTITLNKEVSIDVIKQKIEDIGFKVNQ